MGVVVAVDVEDGQDVHVHLVQQAGHLGVASVGGQGLGKIKIGSSIREEGRPIKFSAEMFSMTVGVCSIWGLSPNNHQASTTQMWTVLKQGSSSTPNAVGRPSNNLLHMYLIAAATLCFFYYFIGIGSWQIHVHLFVDLTV